MFLDDHDYSYFALFERCREMILIEVLLGEEAERRRVNQNVNAKRREGFEDQSFLFYGRGYEHDGRDRGHDRDRDRKRYRVQQQEATH